MTTNVEKINILHLPDDALAIVVEQLLHEMSITSICNLIESNSKINKMLKHQLPTVFKMFKERLESDVNQANLKYEKKMTVYADTTVVIVKDVLKRYIDLVPTENVQINDMLTTITETLTQLNNGGCSQYLNIFKDTKKEYLEAYKTLQLTEHKLSSVTVWSKHF